MKSKSRRDIQREEILVMTLEQRTRLYWQMSRACRHPKAPPISCEEVINKLADIEECTHSKKKLSLKVTELLDDVIGTPQKQEPAAEIEFTKLNAYYGRSADFIIIDEYGYFNDEDFDDEPPRAA